MEAIGQHLDRRLPQRSAIGVRRNLVDQVAGHIYFLRRTDQLAGTDHGLAVLIEAGRAARAEREKLEERAREAVRAWAKLEQAYEQAGAKYDHRAQRTIGAQMERFAKELKRDPQLDSVLRQRGQQLGIAEGSRLARVVQSQSSITS